MENLYLAIPLAPLLGAILAAWVIYWIASGEPDGYDLANGLANNGYGDHSPHGYSMQAGFAVELVLTLGFLIVILGATDRRAPAGFAPIAIGLCLTLIHLISIPVTNTSVNPARSTGPALLVGDWAQAGVEFASIERAEMELADDGRFVDFEKCFEFADRILVDV